jgi:hypothetical protein
MGILMYIFIRKVTKLRSVADAARRAKSGIGQIAGSRTDSGRIMYWMEAKASVSL